MNKHYIDLKIDTLDNLRTLKELYRFNIEVYNVIYNKKSIIVKINYDDYKKIDKYYKCHIIKHYNYIGIKNNILKNKYNIISLIIFYILIFIMSHIVINIKIIDSNYEMVDLITYELNKNDLKKYTFIKNYDELSVIKDKILNNNKDKIEWLEIESIGMTYVVKVEDRIINNIEKENKYCNIVAKKDGLIKGYNITKGEALININDYVKEDDILITGRINYNEENKNNVCAEGKIIANTWYNMNIKINKKYEEKKYTGKKRVNITIKNNDKKYRLFKDRLESFEDKNKKLIKIFNTELYITNDYEIEYETKYYNEEEVDKLIEEEIKNKFDDLLKEDYKIISKKVLKKEEKDSIIDIDIFIIVEENIAKSVEYQIME